MPLSDSAATVKIAGQQLAITPAERTCGTYVVQPDSGSLCQRCAT